MENRHIYFKGMLQYSENGAVKDKLQFFQHERTR